MEGFFVVSLGKEDGGLVFFALGGGAFSLGPVVGILFVEPESMSCCKARGGRGGGWGNCFGGFGKA